MGVHAGGAPHEHEPARASGPAAPMAPARRRQRRLAAVVLGAALCAAACAWGAGAGGQRATALLGVPLPLPLPLPLPGYHPPPPGRADAAAERDYQSTMARVMTTFGGRSGGRGRLPGPAAGQQALQRALLRARAQAASRVLGLLHPGDLALRGSVAAGALNARLGERSSPGMGAGLRHITPAAAAVASVVQRGGSSGLEEQAKLVGQIANAGGLARAGGLGLGSVADRASAAAEADSVFKGGAIAGARAWRQCGAVASRPHHLLWLTTL
jgi:hypothetical protein